MSHQVITEYVDVNGIRTAFRRLGRAEGTPLLLLQHFTGTMDNWDPAVVHALAERRPVILLDNAGVGASHGETPDRVEPMANHAIAFIEALQPGRVDVLGFSLGGFIAQRIAQRRPELLRKVILAGTCAPGQGAGTFRQVIAGNVWVVAEDRCSRDQHQVVFRQCLGQWRNRQRQRPRHRGRHLGDRSTRHARTRADDGRRRGAPAGHPDRCRRLRRRRVDRARAA